MKTHAIRIHEYGGPEVLQWEAIDLPDPAPGEARIRHTAIGLNLIDTYHRTGLYPLELPTGIGSEAAGIVEAIGEGVTDVAVGDRVVYTGMPIGAYAEHRNFAAERLVQIPDGISDEVAAAVLLKGLTTWYLLRRSYAVQPGDPILLYAAAGGVGSLASQWAKQLGATVIGVVSTEEKAELGHAQHCAWETVQRGHAVANGCYLAAVNRSGTHDGTEFWGQSFVANPYGEITAKGSIEHEEIVTADKTREMVAGYVEETNEKLNRWETVKKFRILDHDLSVDSGELTPSMKVKRGVVENNYSDVIDEMYAEGK